MNKEIAKIAKIAKGVIEFLKAGHNLNLLPDLIAALEQINRQINDSNKAVVQSTYKLTAIEVGQIQKALFYIFKKKLQIVNQIDRSLIGGLKITVQDKVIDPTLDHTLENLKDKIDHD